MSKIDVSKLLDYCNYPKDHFSQYGIDCMIGKNNLGILRYIDNNSDILGVAHLDSVGIDSKPLHDKHANIVKSVMLDDRLGVYLILDLLPKLGIKFDILLTDNEELCQSTAWYFRSKKQYNWIFELDRRGLDVVCYQYTHDKLTKILNKSGYYDVGIGTYTDIVDLEHLSAAGLNFGIGYLNQHTVNCYADIGIVEYSIDKFIRFYNQNKNKILPFNVTPQKYHYPVYPIYTPREYTNANIDNWSVVDTLPDIKDNPGYIDNNMCLYCDKDIDEEDNINIFLDFGLCLDCYKYFYLEDDPK